MAYPPRLCFEGAIYHVTARGDNRESTFLDGEDYKKYLALLERNKAQLQFKLHAYALMPNHIHLLLEPGTTATVSRIMQGLTIAYTKWFNARHRRVGHVFQGRFRSRLIERDVYLLVASRYVHRNPVRAKLVRQPADYVWSSYRAYVNTQGDSGGFVDQGLVLALVGQDPSTQRVRYREFVEGAFWSEDSSSTAWLTQPVVGSAEFVQAISVRFGLRAPLRHPSPNTISDMEGGLDI